jgi:hypothetical protein
MLRRELPERIELRQLCGQIVWLREGENEWTGPAEQALELVRRVDPALGFWSTFAGADAT